jgi:multicomponent Na+:H+ antiporter subunit G
MTLALDILSWALILSGSGFAILGGLGLLRLPDFFTRLHAASLVDTLGLALLLAGLMVQAAAGAHWISLVKLLLIGVLVYFTSPVAAHALARAALGQGVAPRPCEDRTHGAALEDARAAVRHGEEDGAP